MAQFVFDTKEAADAARADNARLRSYKVSLPVQGSEEPHVKFVIASTQELAVARFASESLNCAVSLASRKEPTAAEGTPRVTQKQIQELVLKASEETNPEEQVKMLATVRTLKQQFEAQKAAKAASATAPESSAVAPTPPAPPSPPAPPLPVGTSA